MDLLNIPYKKYKLANGLEIILYANNSLPFTAVNLWYRAGSANEIAGKTGLAHLFEHMMFQGSKNVAKEMHFKYIQEAGGSLNASTSFDRTNYFEKLPANELELALWLESDRMGYFLDALDQTKLENQKSVVLNERLERYDNQPYGLAWEKLISNIYSDEHPYNWPTIGFTADIKGYTLDDVRDFFIKYYSPSNATMVIAGNMNVQKTISWIEKYFSDIRADGNPVIPESISSKRSQEKIIVYEDKVNLERIYLAWNSVNAFETDDANLDLLSDILTGSKNARLTRKLLYELEIVQDVNSMQFSGKYGGHFMIVATAKPGKSLDDIKKIIFDEIDFISNATINERELTRSKNVITSNFIYSLQNIDTVADLLNLYNFYLGEPNSFNFDLNRYINTESQDVTNAAAKYLKNNFTELRIIPGNKNAN
ncbi:MAG: insulinase family protein [Ignavibacteriota bacterium]|jgi:zinc protease|nr:MAG: insulinase family protein [Chlorobiota bacterium]MBE7477258.1 insulinase family protein [Ignavibacteriales bacterium]MBL1122644.1 insulinase family protein [Ignavibacteriota bacterium]MCC7095065.1 insulinase family protein [Ignavibacteriaceae bacterium]MCE7856275.1 insulinase family protein [Ignavibacteria bacterium CHB3]MEB2295671.1 pitrilysin family protein [Ignavibacteria bacterium]